jgi:hypothetical protein
MVGIATEAPEKPGAETKGRSLEEIEVLREHHVPVRASGV